MPEQHEGVPGGDAATTPVPGGTPVEPRILAAWREWLAALATDAEAAIAAAHVYAELSPDARDRWLDALAEDGPKLDVPKIAIYAPLLSVESDPGRRSRMEKAMGEDLARPSKRSLIRALRGIAADGARIVGLVTPLYLKFVQVLCCRFHPERGFVWVRHEPILRECDAPVDGSIMEDVLLEATPLNPVVEELAHAVLAQRRSGAEIPGALRIFAHLFDAHLDPDPEG